jgi:hypothetical protein
MDSLPMAPSCTLDDAGLHAQRERYRQAGEGAVVVERHARRLTLDLAAGVDAAAVEGIIATERECCPFFDIDWNPGGRRLTVSVSRAEDERALDAIAFALGIG